MHPVNTIQALITNIVSIHCTAEVGTIQNRRRFICVGSTSENITSQTHLFHYVSQLHSHPFQ